MAKAKRRKPAPKKAPMITVQDEVKAPVKDSQGEDILYVENKRVRTDGSEPIPKRRRTSAKPRGPIVLAGPNGAAGRPNMDSAPGEGDAIRAEMEDADVRTKFAASLRSRAEGDFTRDVTQTERNKRNKFIVESLQATDPKAQKKRTVRKIERGIQTAKDKKFGITPERHEVYAAVRAKKITADQGKELLKPSPELTKKELGKVIRGALASEKTPTPKNTSVNRRGMTLINTATVSQSGTAPGGAPARPVGNDAGGQKVKVGPGMGAPLAVDPKTGKAPARRVMRPKRDILADRRRRKNKTPRLGTSNFDPNSSLVMGNRPDSDLVRERDRGQRKSKKGVNAASLVTAEQKQTYRSSLEPSRISEQLAPLFAKKETPSFTEVSQHFADKYVGGAISELGSVDAPVTIPGGMTDKAVAARGMYFAKVAQTHAIDARAKAMRKEQSSQALAAGKQLDSTLDDKKTGDREKLKALGAHSVTGGLYAADAEVREGIRKRDYELRKANKKARKAGRELSEDEIMNLPGISREEAVGLTPHEDATKALGERGGLAYYMGSTEKRGLTYNKGLKDAKIAEIAHHTRMPIPHVRNFINDHGIDVHKLHEDLSEQVYSPGHAKKAFVPTSDPLQTTEVVRFHKSGRVRTRKGRDAEGRNLPARWESIPTSPAKEGIPDSAIMSWVNKLGSLIHTNQSTRNLKGPNPYLAEEARHFGAHNKSVSQSVVEGTKFSVGSSGEVSLPTASRPGFTPGRKRRGAVPDVSFTGTEPKKTAGTQQVLQPADILAANIALSGQFRANRQGPKPPEPKTDAE